MQKLEEEFNVDLTGKPQHGFKPKHSTSTASLLLQSLLGRATNDNKYAMMGSLDLSAMFGVVNVGLLIEKIKDHWSSIVFNQFHNQMANN